MPLHAAYGQRTRFEEPARLMDCVEEAHRLDGTRVHWRASIAGRRKEWEAPIAPA